MAIRWADSSPHPPCPLVQLSKQKEGVACKLLMKKRMFRETDETITEPKFINLSYIQAQHDFLQVCTIPGPPATEVPPMSTGPFVAGGFMPLPFLHLGCIAISQLSAPWRPWLPTS